MGTTSTVSRGSALRARSGKAKKTFVPPRNWAALSPAAPSMRRAGNAVCIRTGPAAAAGSEGRHIVVDADGVDAIAVVERVIRTCAQNGEGLLARVPQVETQRGPSGRHFYFFAQCGTIAATLKSTAGLTIDGAKTGVDIRAGYRGANGSAGSAVTNEGVGFVFAPPTVVTGGGRYTLLPGPAIHEAPFMPDSLARALADGGATGTAVARNQRASGRPTAPTALTACTRVVSFFASQPKRRAPSSHSTSAMRLNWGGNRH
jgi:hypothetical protein